jgi:hypothetical protein
LKGSRVSLTTRSENRGRRQGAKTGAKTGGKDRGAKTGGQRQGTKHGAENISDYHSKHLALRVIVTAKSSRDFFWARVI